MTSRFQNVFSIKEPRTIVRRTEPRIRRGSPANIALDYIQITLGLTLVAWSFNALLTPNHIPSSGVIGLSTVLDVRFSLEPAVTQWSINIPLLLLSWFWMGAKMGLKTVFGSLLLPVLVLLTRHSLVLTHDPLLASIFGGLFMGIGLGFVFRAEGSSGGFGIAAQMLHRRFGLSISLALFCLDCAVLASAAILMNPERALYALIGVYACRRAIDVVQNGWHFSKTALIICSDPEAVSQAILNDLHRGLTILNGTGGFTGQPRSVLMVVCGATEIARLKKLVAQHDPQAFVILWDAMEVLGEGFKV